MCQKVKKEINYNWLYFIVHIVIKHNLKEHCNSETLKKKTTLLLTFMISLSFCFAQVPTFIKAESQKEVKVFFHAYENIYHHITIIEAKETLNMHALDTAYLYKA